MPKSSLITERESGLATQVPAASADTPARLEATDVEATCWADRTRATCPLWYATHRTSPIRAVVATVSPAWMPTPTRIGASRVEASAAAATMARPASTAADAAGKTT